MEILQVAVLVFLIGVGIFVAWTVWDVRHEARQSIENAEVEFLRTQVRILTEHKVRMERVEAGLRETMPPQKPPVEPMPDEVSQIVGLYESGPVRDALMREIGTARKQGVSWDLIENRMRASLPPEE